jgi:Cu-processing system ATP-binding protein
LSDLIVCADLSFQWPNGKGLAGINLNVRAEELTAIIGRNGAGKTTLINLIMGLLIPASGDIYVLGERVNAAHEVGYKKSIGYCPADGGLIGNLTIKENYELISFLRCGLKKIWKEQSEWIEKFQIQDLLACRFEELSSGQRRRAMIVSALIGSPPIVILDEPGNDLDVEGLFILSELLKGSLPERAILVSTHILDVVRHAKGNVVFMEKGVKIHEGRIKSEKTLEDVYRELIWGS